jgi:hypothetical protein
MFFRRNARLWLFAGHAAEDKAENIASQKKPLCP